MTIEELLDIEAIKQVRYLYSHYYDGNRLDDLISLFTDDAVCEFGANFGGDWVGKEQIRATLQQFIVPGSEAEFEILWLAANGNAVLTERIDHLTIAGKQVSLRVMGTFEVTDDGKLGAWRDYFDMAQLTAQIS